MPPPFDLDAYLARIGYSGPRTPTASVLDGVLRRHVYSIPFENIDVQLGRPIRLDPVSLQQKLIHDRRGGYCFEQNGLLQLALRSIGFTVIPLFARVRWQVPPEVTTPFTHMLLRVECEGASWIADAGFGSGSLTAPIRLVLDEPQPTPHEARRLVRRGDWHVHQTQTPSGQWEDLCVFTLTPTPAIDYEVSNWWTSTHPNSRFKQNLLLALAADGLRHTLMNRDFTTRWTDGRVEQRIIDSPAELVALLADKFGLALPPDTVFTIPAAPWPTPGRT